MAGSRYLSASAAPFLPALVECHAAAALAGLECALMACPRAPFWTPEAVHAMRAVLELRTTLLKRPQVNPSLIAQHAGCRVHTKADHPRYCYQPMMCNGWLMILIGPKDARTCPLG